MSGIVGAGGNAGAVAAGFLFKMEDVSYPQALFIIGAIVCVISLFAFLVRFTEEAEAEARKELSEVYQLNEKAQPKPVRNNFV